MNRLVLADYAPSANLRGARRLNAHVSPRSPGPFATLVFAFFLRSPASDLPTFISFLNRPVYYAEDNGGRLYAFTSFECSFLWHLDSLLFYIASEAAFRWSRSLTKAAIFSRRDVDRSFPKSGCRFGCLHPLRRNRFFPNSFCVRSDWRL